ncbi:hypothetical protein VB620_05240 [Nodularia harveyana UHCC-0300]|uniref:Uncharacterized protein n=1 Tax=Nodularia harveyana UHCC-0300 TaxID=2974287 RepID=A0ABU5UB41_9CYAN|nr:hypothetical protein [Nodularia harveyana]MEA5580745.1 hypothetical protein [Nodularia harveyana UHCC-0300]
MLVLDLINSLLVYTLDYSSEFQFWQFFGNIADIGQLKLATALF